MIKININEDIITIEGHSGYGVEGTELYIEKLEAEAGETFKFDKVLMVDGKVGTPLVDGAYVEAEVVKNGKGKKIIVYKYNQKKNYRRKQGHRQPYTKVVVKKIVVK